LKSAVLYQTLDYIDGARGAAILLSQKHRRWVTRSPIRFRRKTSIKDLPKAIPILCGGKAELLGGSLPVQSGARVGLSEFDEAEGSDLP